MAYKTRQSHLQKRGRIYYFRITVPKKLLPVFGRTEYNKSLGIEEYRQACCICSAYSLYVEKYFKLVEQMRPSSAEINLLIRNHFEKCLMDAEDSRWVLYETLQDGTANDNIETIISDLKKAYQELVSLARSQQYGAYQIGVTKELLNWQGFDLPEASEEFEGLAKGVMDAQLEAKRIEIAGYEKDHKSLNIQHPLLKDCQNYLLHPDYERNKKYRHQSYHGASALSLREAISEYLHSRVQESDGWRTNHTRYLNRLTDILGEQCRL